jgi:hypothetical protein
MREFHRILLGSVRARKIEKTALGVGIDFPTCLLGRHNSTMDGAMFSGDQGGLQRGEAVCGKPYPTSP